jgi:hypothetical protein
VEQVERQEGEARVFGGPDGVTDELSLCIIFGKYRIHLKITQFFRLVVMLPI